MKKTATRVLAMSAVAVALCNVGGPVWKPFVPQKRCPKCTRSDGKHNSLCPDKPRG